MPYFNPLALVIPGFLIFLGIEYWLALRKQKSHLFNYESSIANISVGIAERLLNLLITGSFYGLYNYVYESYRLFTIPNQWWVWILLLLFTDFIWYWYHRLGHEVNLFWGAHIVHHQSAEFNYTVSARITTLQAIVRNIFWITLPLVGFHPSMVIAILVVHGAYSFFTHTQLIGKLGWLDHILITPSHHGVHHASNPKYLDKNYGDIFVCWDKLFGTFQKEEEKPVYGLTHPLHSRSFLWQHFHYYIELLEACRRSKSVRKSIGILLGKPSLVDSSIRGNLEKRFLPTKSGFKHTLRFKVYLNVQVIGCLVALFVFTLLFNELTYLDKTFIVILILITLVNCGAILEQHRWVFQSELIRVVIFFTYISIAQKSTILFITPLTVILIVSLIDSIEERYFKLIYGQQRA